MQLAEEELYLTVRDENRSSWLSRQNSPKVEEAIYIILLHFANIKALITEVENDIYVYKIRWRISGNCKKRKLIATA